jgi:DNA-binding transcriptional ArsR family regulator
MVIAVDLARPHRLLAHPLDGSVVSVLSGTTRPLTGREVARLATEGSQPGISKALGRLAEGGLVERQEAGNALLYTLNRDHLAAPAAMMLADLRNALIARLKETVADWHPKPLHLSVFGSAARGDGGLDSDIDLLLVRPIAIAAEDPQWRSQLDRLADSVRRWTGNPAAISELAESDLGRLAKERPPIVDALSAEAITVHGADAARLFREIST